MNKFINDRGSLGSLAGRMALPFGTIPGVMR